MQPYVKQIELPKQDLTLPFQKEEYFWKDKKGEIFPYYKDDIRRDINVLKPSTFLPFMAALDIPFFEEEWLYLVEHEIQYFGKTTNVFGKYLNKMKFAGYRSFGFDDSSKKYYSASAYENAKYTIR